MNRSEVLEKFNDVLSKVMDFLGDIFDTQLKVRAWWYMLVVVTCAALGSVLPWYLGIPFSGLIGSISGVLIAKAELDSDELERERSLMNGEG